MPIDSQLMDQVFDSPQLPSLPAVALRIIELVQQDEVDIDRIAETISLDPALSTKMLKTVNSSFYGMSKTIGSVHQAVVVLGLNSVKTLALGFSLVSNLTDKGGDYFDHTSFWRRSLYSATAAKQFCDHLHILQAEEVFMSSLLQDVGVLAMSQVLGVQYMPMAHQSAKDHSQLAALEQETFGGDHMEVGAALAESWGLPPLLVESIRLHENPEAAAENLKPLIRTVAAGGLAADLIEAPDDESRVAAFYAKIHAWFEIDQATAETILREVFKHANEAQRLFELPTGDLPASEDIMAKANEVLAKIQSEEVEAEADADGDSPASLDESVASPPAAQAGDEMSHGLQGKASFVARVQTHYLQADASSPLSLVFIDIDQFAKVDAAHGADAAGQVLTAIAGAMAAQLQGEAQLFHLGDDDFIALCPGLSRADAALLAEAIRSSIEQTPFPIPDDSSSGTVSVTASLGVATYEGVLFKRPDQLISAACKGVTAAKGGGSNLVRIFVPRQSKPNPNQEAA